MKKWLYVGLGILSILGALSCQKKSYDEQHINVVLRDIGHRLLLHAKDSTSRVLPIVKVDDATYQIAFQNPFAFSPDTLINLTQQRLRQHLPSAEYIVNVLDCSSHAVFFAYQINTYTDDILPCQGREQPEGCYKIQITFLESSRTKIYWAWALLIPISLVGLYIFRRREGAIEENSEPPISPEMGLKMGNFTFVPEKNALKMGLEAVELTDREAKLLHLFAQNPNQTLSREYLMKVIWEDEGTFVISRNLDVLVSKLRKKLQSDASVKIVNVHAKGYRLEV